MAERRASETSVTAAEVRAVHQLIDKPPLILEDPISLQLLDEATRARLREYAVTRGRDAKCTRTDGEAAEMSHPDRSILRSLLLIRSRFAEDRLAEAVARGIRQYVLLGAGLDTFAYRQPAWAADLQIFEVDHAASQADKRRRVQAAGLGTPANLKSVPCDFEADPLGPALEQAGFDCAAPAFFSCQGVTMYLTVGAVRSILKFVAGTRRPGEIVLTFAPGQRKRSFLAWQPRRKWLRPRERWLTMLDAQSMQQELLNLGFSDLLFPTPRMIEQRYMQGRTDGLPVPRQLTIVSAKV
jgi:methyltransferase (TIGR00027 family)